MDEENFSLLCQRHKVCIHFINTLCKVRWTGYFTSLLLKHNVFTGTSQNSWMQVKIMFSPSGQTTEIMWA